MASSPCIWLTRPRDDSGALAAELRAHGIDSIIAPVMRIEPQTPALPTTMPDALLATSRHAAHLFAQLPHTWHHVPVYCVGGSTAEAVQQAGFGQCITGNGYIDGLLPIIRNGMQGGTRLLYLAGEETRADVASLLGGHGIAVETRVAYTAPAETTLDPALAEALHHGILTGAVFFSPRSAMLAHHLLHDHGLDTRTAGRDAYCLSLAVAEAAAALPWRKLYSCHQPTRGAMVDLIVSRHADRVL